MMHTVRKFVWQVIISSICAAHGFKVLGVGAPRTGTQSLERALEQLGLRSLSVFTCYQCEGHAYDYLFRGGPLKTVFEAMMQSDFAMNEPYHLLYPEVLEQYPEAKFILTIQPSPKHWYHSAIRHMLWARNQTKTFPDKDKAPLEINTSLVGFNVSELHAPQNQCANEGNQCAAHTRPRALYGIPDLTDLTSNPLAPLERPEEVARYFNCEFDKPEQTHPMIRQCAEGYVQHNRNVFRTIPSEKLLVFNVQDGWEPLCKFLGYPVPSEPFPFIDRFAVSDRPGQNFSA